MMKFRPFTTFFSLSWMTDRLGLRSYTDKPPLITNSQVRFQAGGRAGGGRAGGGRADGNCVNAP